MKNRIIKFRAWDIIDKEMYDVISVGNIEFLNYIEGGFYDESENNIVYLRKENSEDWQTPLEQVELMQFTGLKDKNGKDIFEGHILKGIYRKNVNGKNDLNIGKVIWYHNAWYVWFGFIDDLKILLYDLSAKTIMVDNYLDKFEIIGNIYENSDLLDNNKEGN